MRIFYFVGGPTPGNAGEFFQKLAQAGGPPPGWRIYPHASGDGKALHVIEAEAEDPIIAHLARFADIYEATVLTEIVESPSRPAASSQELSMTVPAAVSGYGGTLCPP
jgi:hypothetical protein